MKQQIYILCLLASIFVSGCSKDEITKYKPIAQFGWTQPTSAPAMVTFKNASLHATSYFWDFGDNSYSTEVSPEHYYTSDGPFTVKLTAFGPEGSSSSIRYIFF